nr:ribonuclease H [Tanacetum cinerariifolium]
MQNIPSSTPYVPPTKKNWEILFLPMFNEYLNLPPCVDPQVPAIIAPKLVVSIVDTPMVEKFKLDEDREGKVMDPSHYREQVENGVIELYFVNTEYQLADLFTKALGRDKIEFLTTKLGMRSFTPEMLKQLMNEEDE